MKKLIFLFLVVFFSKTYSQNYEPLELAKKIFSKEKFANLENYIIGEYDGNPNGEHLQKGTKTYFLILEQSEKYATINMTIKDSLGKGVDTYLHFEKDSVWKLEAFRTLAMTGIIEQVKYELEKLTIEEVDERIVKYNKEKDKDKSNSVFESRESYFFELGNCKLTVDFDDNIIKHFNDNKKEFERLRDSAQKEFDKRDRSNSGRTKLIIGLEKDYKKLFINSVNTGGFELGNCINFFIGGILDNNVGYMYFKDKDDLPQINPNLIIMIREIGDGWYIYKMT